jgi:hypothetical protein
MPIGHQYGLIFNYPHPHYIFEYTIEPLYLLIKIYPPDVRSIFLRVILAT